MSMRRNFYYDYEAEFADYGNDYYGGDEGEIPSCANCGKTDGDCYIGEDELGNTFCSIKCKREFYKRKSG